MTRSPTRPCAGLLRLVGLLVGVVLLAACQVRTQVDVLVRHDGSGIVTTTVTLDKAAAAQIPDLGSQLRVADLRKAGWTLTGPRATPDGGIVVSARKPFARAADAGRVLAELSGADGPFRGFAVTRRRSFASTSVHVVGTVDLSRGVDAFSDADLARLLDGKPLGRTPDELKLLAGGDVAAAAPFTVRVLLPGGEVRTFSPRLGGPAVAIDAGSTSTDGQAWLLVGGAAVALVVAVLVFVDARRRPHRRIRRPSERGTGTYQRRPYQTIDEFEEGPVPGVGGPPTTVRLHPADSPVHPVHPDEG